MASLSPDFFLTPDGKRVPSIFQVHQPNSIPRLDSPESSGYVVLSPAHYFNAQQQQEMTNLEKVDVEKMLDEFHMHYKQLCNHLIILRSRVDERCRQKSQIMEEQKKLEEEESELIKKFAYLKEKKKRLREKKQKLAEKKSVGVASSLLLSPSSSSSSSSSASVSCSSSSSSSSYSSSSSSLACSSSSSSFPVSSSSSADLSKSYWNLKASLSVEKQSIIIKQVQEWREKAPGTYRKNTKYLCPYQLCNQNVSADRQLDHLTLHHNKLCQYSWLKESKSFPFTNLTTTPNWSFGNLNVPEDTEEEKKIQQQVKNQIEEWRRQAFKADQNKCPVEGCDTIVADQYLTPHLTKHIMDKPFLCKMGNCDSSFVLSQYRQTHQQHCTGVGAGTGSGERRKRKHIK